MILALLIFLYQGPKRCTTTKIERNLTKKDPTDPICAWASCEVENSNRKGHFKQELIFTFKRNGASTSSLLHVLRCMGF